MFPFHTWLPDAHVQAPTAGSVILAAVMLKLGAYGFIRFALPIFPAAAHTFAPAIIVLSLIAIIYGAIVALVQPDLKKLVAYSSVSHMGFVTLGIFVFNTQGMDGAILQMVNHGLITGALFLLVGVIYERTHDRTIAKMGGVAGVLPVYAVALGFFVFASGGLPGLSGFVGEFLVLVGAFEYSPVVAAIATFCMILAAGYLLWMFQRIAFGELSDFLKGLGHHLTDMTPVEILTLAPLAALTVVFGLFPGLVLDLVRGSVTTVLGDVGRQSAAEIPAQTALILIALPILYVIGRLIWVARIDLTGGGPERPESPGEPGTAVEAVS
jgi:NADH-quinone oxidoreductase subunit M